MWGDPAAGVCPQSGPMTATVAEPRAEAESRSRLPTVGTRTGSEAGCGRQAGAEQLSPKVIKAHMGRARRPEGTDSAPYLGDLPEAIGGEVSRGRSSEEGR